MTIPTNFQKLTKDFEPDPGQRWIEVTCGMAGWFAVIMWVNDEDGNLGPFTEPWETGYGRYAKREEAELEALLLAEEEDLPYYIKE